MYTDKVMWVFINAIYSLFGGDSEKMKLATYLCEKALQNDVNGFIDVLCTIDDVEFCNDEGDESRAESINCDYDVGPTSPGGNCFAVPTDNYKTYSQNTLKFMVIGMDYAGGKLL